MSRRPLGFTLIEILITVFVIGIGLLGMAGLQVIAKKATYDATQRTLASQAAQSIVTRMRANAGVAGAYVTDDAVALEIPGTACESTDCTPEALAAWDLYRWGRTLAEGGEVDDEGVASGGLVSPTGCVLNGATAGHYRVAIAWRGITPLPPPEDPDDVTDPANVACGSDAYLDAEGIDDFRRVLVLDAFVADPTP